MANQGSEWSHRKCSLGSGSALGHELGWPWRRRVRRDSCQSTLVTAVPSWHLAVDLKILSSTLPRNLSTKPCDWLLHRALHIYFSTPLLGLSSKNCICLQGTTLCSEITHMYTLWKICILLSNYYILKPT